MDTIEHISELEFSGFDKTKSVNSTITNNVLLEN